MSKNGWGFWSSFFMALIIQFVPVPNSLRLGITVISAVGLIICGIGWLTARTDDKNKPIREKLAEFLDEGQHFKSLVENPKLQVLPGDQIKLWSTKLDTYLKATLGNAYALRLVNQDDLPQDVPKLPEGVNPAIWWGLHVRCVRLHEFIKEFSRD